MLSNIYVKIEGRKQSPILSKKLCQIAINLQLIIYQNKKAKHEFKLCMIGLKKTGKR